MKPIAWPFPAGNSALATVGVVVALLAFAPQSVARPSTRPQMGGTLRVSILERVDIVDPRQWPAGAGEAAAAERLSSLVFDRLARLDEHGTPQPALALSWQKDAPAKRWQFRLREGVKFSDGTQLTPPIAAMALQQMLGVSFDVSATPDSVVIQADRSLPDLPAQLATGRYFIFHDGADGALTGTGPFVLTMLESMGRSAQLTFTANESCWAGRPFVDKVIVAMNVDVEQEANSVAFGQADVVELPASQVRRTVQRGVRTVSSEPVELIALVFAGDRAGGRAALQNTHFREGVSLAIDRASVADVILQRHGVVAGGLLPNWISGYGHLFPPAFDLVRAKELLAASGRELSRSAPLVLVYDSGDAEARAIADRVAVNLREAEITVQVQEQIAGVTSKRPAADLRLVRHRMAAPARAMALAGVLNWLGETTSPDLGTLDQDYAAERGIIDAFRVIPLVHVSESYGLSPQVHDWLAPRWGGWNLADVWIGAPPSAGSGTP
jgi:peptide/nickel transport system substrate-binding protein